MPKPVTLSVAGLTPWQRHLARWDGCTACVLSQCRHKLIFAKGNLPCDVLFIGESPGESEDAIGQPFIGPAGKLLDSQIRRAFQESRINPIDIRIAFTNLVCCWPKPQGKDKRDPKAAEIRACAPRLQEFVRLSVPKFIIAVGGLSRDWLPKILPDEHKETPTTDIIHPAAILRQDPPLRHHPNDQSIVQIADAFMEVAALLAT